jgi:hypothetical protein
MKGPLIYYELKDMYGTNLSDSKLATELRKSVLEEIDLGFNVEIDFDGVDSISKNWAKNAFGTIVKQKGGDFFKNHILLTNLNKKNMTVILKEIKEILEV